MARILLVLRPDRGGVFNNVAQLSAALDARGHEVALCGPIANRAKDLPVRVIPIEIKRSGTPWGNARPLLEFVRLARRFRPDLVHAHGSQAGAIARIGRIATPSPVLFTPHLYAFDNYFVRGAERAAYRLVERSLAPVATRVLCVCEAEQRLAAQIGPQSRTRVVHNGIEPVRTNGVHPAVAELMSEGPVLCTVAELRPSKGVATLVEAMPAVLDRHPSARLVIAGEGDQRTEIERRVRELGVGHAVRLLGATDGPAEVLAGGFAFVNPAYAESFPYTVIEAMSAGLPVIATDVGGTREAIEDGESGFLVPPHDPAVLAAAINRLLDDPGMALSMGGNAERAFKERFTLDRMIEGTLAVYAELGI